MVADGPLFLLCLADCTVLLGLNVAFLIILSDLESDYMNATTACHKLNSYIFVCCLFTIGVRILYTLVSE